MTTRLWLAVLVAVVGLPAPGITACATGLAIAQSGPAPMPDRPDLEARNLFQAGRYAGALAIYQRLHAETHHPTYLRNIGRCHQMMGEPRPAIDSFQAYLREAHHLEPAERAEIDGYIAEMQRLELGAFPAGGPVATASPPGAPGWAPSHSTTTAVSSPSSYAVTHKWWFWTGLGALALTGVIVLVAASGGKDRLPCPGGAVCPP